MVRAFLALPLPEPLRQRLLLVQQMLRLPGGAARPVPPEALHMTLVFVGEHPEPVIEDLHHALEGLRSPAFDLRLRGLDRFGGDTPRSIHAAVVPDATLAHLQRKLAQAVRRNGIALDRRRFAPHVTLARLDWRSIAAADRDRLAMAIAANGDFTAGPARIAAYALYRSFPGKHGHHREELARYPLHEPLP